MRGAETHSSWPEGRGGWAVGWRPSRAGRSSPAAGGAGAGRFRLRAGLPERSTAHEALRRTPGLWVTVMMTHTYQALEVSPGRKVNDQVDAFTLLTAAQEEGVAVITAPSSQVCGEGCQALAKAPGCTAGTSACCDSTALGRRGPGSRAQKGGGSLCLLTLCPTLSYRDLPVSSLSWSVSAPSSFSPPPPLACAWLRCQHHRLSPGPLGPNQHFSLGLS